MFLEDLVEFLKKHYKHVQLYRAQGAAPDCIYIKDNGAVLILTVTRRVTDEAP